METWPSRGRAELSGCAASTACSRLAEPAASAPEVTASHRSERPRDAGSLLYPARDVGYEGVVASLRLKALRDSIEDYEYFAILERFGAANEAEKIVLPLAESFFRWNPEPGAYDEARARLAALILARQQTDLEGVSKPVLLEGWLVAERSDAPVIRQSGASLRSATSHPFPKVGSETRSR